MHPRMKTRAMAAAGGTPKVEDKKAGHKRVVFCDTTTVIPVLMQVRKEAASLAETEMELAGATIEFSFDISQEQTLFRVSGPSSMFAKFDRNKPGWLIQASPDSLIVPL